MNQLSYDSQEHHSSVVPYFAITPHTLITDWSIQNSSECSLENQAPLAAEDLLAGRSLCNGLQEPYGTRLSACHRAL